LNLYEGMFLLDNNVVREDWTKAKEVATGILEKHGASITIARRWAERSLAYTIKKVNRGTYLLAYFEADPGSITIIRRDLELNETVMRYLVLKCEEVPEGEQELHDAELSTDFTVPEPPEDHVVDSTGEEDNESNDLDIDVGFDSGLDASPVRPKAAAPKVEEKEEEAPAAEVTESKEETKEAPAAEAAESKEETTEAAASEEA
jgi:small subunit ribosomal protein S6